MVLFWNNPILKRVSARSHLKWPTQERWPGGNGNIDGTSSGARSSGKTEHHSALVEKLSTWRPLMANE
jgi:hypothetical protein